MRIISPTEAAPGPSARASIDSRLATLATASNAVDREALEQMARVLADARERQRSVYTLGNGGRAATALYFANDLAMADGGGIGVRAICLSGNISLVSDFARSSTRPSRQLESAGEHAAPGAARRRDRQV